MFWRGQETARQKNRFEPLAQLAEHLTFNQRVRGSNPRWLTKEKPPGNGLKSSLPVVFSFLYIQQIQRTI